MTEKLKKTWMLILGALLLVSLVFNVFLYTKKTGTEASAMQYKQNYIAATDSLKQIQLDNGNVLHEKAMYILKTEDLQKQLNISRQEYNDLETKLNSAIAALARAEAEVRVDTLRIPSDPIVMTDTLVSPFTWSDEYLVLGGTTIASPSFSLTEIDKIRMNVPLTMGITQDYKMFATTDNPYVTFTSIESVIDERIIPKKKRWSLGVTLGFGTTYGLAHKKFDYGPTLNFGLSYALCQF